MLFGNGEVKRLQIWRDAKFFEGNVFWQLLGLKIVAGEKGKCTIELPFQEKFVNIYGNIHGGIIASMLDVSMNVTAILYYLPPGFTTVTAQLNINYLRPAGRERLLAKAELIHCGKKLVVGRSVVEGADNRLIAHGTATLSVLNIKKGMSDETI